MSIIFAVLLLVPAFFGIAFIIWFITSGEYRKTDFYKNKHNVREEVEIFAKPISVENETRERKQLIENLRKVNGNLSEKKYQNTEDLKTNSVHSSKLKVHDAVSDLCEKLEKLLTISVKNKTNHRELARLFHYRLPMITDLLKAYIDAAEIDGMASSLATAEESVINLIEKISALADEIKAAEMDSIKRNLDIELKVAEASMGKKENKPHNQDDVFQKIKAAVS